MLKKNKRYKNLAITNRSRVIMCTQRNNSKCVTEMTFKGHSRSSEMSRFDRAHDFYCRSTVNSPIVYPFAQALVKNREIYIPIYIHPPPVRGYPVGMLKRCLLLELL